MTAACRSVMTARWPLFVVLACAACASSRSDDRGDDDRANGGGNSHGGMADVYRLIVTVTFSADAKNAVATFEQKVDLGDH